MARITIMGEKSKPPKLSGSLLLIAYRTGSVVAYRKRTIALYGSGLTQEITARAIMINRYRVSAMFRIFATASRKLAMINIFSPN